MIASMRCDPVGLNVAAPGKAGIMSAIRAELLPSQETWSAPSNSTSFARATLDPNGRILSPVQNQCRHGDRQDASDVSIAIHSHHCFARRGTTALSFPPEPPALKFDIECRTTARVRGGD